MGVPNRPQSEIARQNHDQGGDYLLALKGNQGTLNDDVSLFLETESAKSVGKRISDSDTNVDCGHGRIETRRCVVSDQIDWLEQKSAWRGLTSVVICPISSQASISRNDSRQVNCENAMIRNKSAQLRLRTPTSPACRLMMQLKFFHGTNSLTCANSVLPTFIFNTKPHKPEIIANDEFQIVDTPKTAKTSAKISFAGFT